MQPFFVDEAPKGLPLAAPMRVLLVEDNDEYAALVERALTRGQHAVRLARAKHMGQALAAVGNRKPDAVLLDLNLPDSDVDNSILLAGSLAQSLPVFVLTGEGDRAAALRALACGVEDYYLKNELDPRALGAQLRAALRRRAQLGCVSPAQLLSPARFREEVRLRIARSPGHALSVSVVELDYFETLRELWGEGWAHRILRSTVDTLHAAIGDGVEIARLATHRFGLVHEPAELERLMVLGDPAHALTQEPEGSLPPDVSHRERYSVTASIGTASTTELRSMADGNADDQALELIAAASDACRRCFARSVAGLHFHLEGGEGGEGSEGGDAGFAS